MVNIVTSPDSESQELREFFGHHPSEDHMSPAPRRCMVGRPVLALFAVVCSAVSPLTTAVSTAAAEPIVLIDTFGPGDTYDIGGIGTPWMPVGPSPFLIGFRFTPAIDVRLSEVTIAAASLLSDVRSFPSGQSPPAAALQFSVRSTVNGVPGAPLETFEYPNLPRFDQLNAVFSATSEQQPLLRAGLPYWLMASGVDGWAVWNLNNSGQRGPLAITEDFGPCCTIFDDTPTGAFRVTGTPSAAAVPEPTSLLLFGTGLLTVEAKRWRQRQRIATVRALVSPARTTRARAIKQCGDLSPAYDHFHQWRIGHRAMVVHAGLQ
jgi:hypothetical protein